MTCECFRCMKTFDPDQMTRCKGCDNYYCPSCWEESDHEAWCALDCEGNLSEYQATGILG